MRVQTFDGFARKLVCGIVNIGIVGHEAAKFTAETEARAREIIRDLLPNDTVVVSGHCHLGGIDIWAEEEADRLGLRKQIYKPKFHGWEAYKTRNKLIAENSDVVHVIVVKELPEGFRGRRHKLCYHCNTTSHVKSGGCWTAKYAERLGKPARWYEI